MDFSLLHANECLMQHTFMCLESQHSGSNSGQTQNHPQLSVLFDSTVNLLVGALQYAASRAKVEILHRLCNPYLHRINARPAVNQPCFGLTNDE